MPRQQATVWPPPPHVPFVEPVVDPYREKTRSALRSLNAGIFLFVGGSVLPIMVLPVIFLLFSAAAQHPFHQIPSLLGLRYLWPLFYILGAYFGIRSILLAKQAQKVGIQVQGFIITVLSVLFIPLSLFLLSL